MLLLDVLEAYHASTISERTIGGKTLFRNVTNRTALTVLPWDVDLNASPRPRYKSLQGIRAMSSAVASPPALTYTDLQGKEAGADLISSPLHRRAK